MHSKKYFCQNNRSCKKVGLKGNFPQFFLISFLKYNRNQDPGFSCIQGGKISNFKSRKIVNLKKKNMFKAHKVIKKEYFEVM